MASFPSAEWFRSFSETLEEDGDFQRAMARFDGSIKFEIGNDTVWIKFYRGNVLEVLGQEAEFGSTFTVAGPTQEWIRLLTEDRNPFGEQQTLGKIEFRGNALEATRITDGLNILVDHLRAETSDTLKLKEKE
jgi:putative sterol carrier protein